MPTTPHFSNTTQQHSPHQARQPSLAHRHADGVRNSYTPGAIWVKMEESSRFLAVAVGPPGTKDEPGEVVLLGANLPVGGGYVVDGNVAHRGDVSCAPLARQLHSP